MDAEGYPWYHIVRGTDLAQGDLLERCPVFLPLADLAEPWDEAPFAWQERDVVVMTQSCDLITGREKVTEVLLCATWGRSDLTSEFVKESDRRFRIQDSRIANPGDTIACDIIEF